MTALSRRGAAPVVLYELNEVPWRVVDWYVGQRPRSKLALVLAGADTYTSITRDEGVLHPWVTWPTLHRSVHNTVHGIRYVNQDLSDAAVYPPVWEKAAFAGLKVGVFGSLQSYPPRSDPAYAFYIPDTFAPGPETIPARYSCFQRFNLRQTGADRAIAKPVAFDGSIVSDVIGLFGNGLSLKTAAQLAAQLVLEKKRAIYRVRRPILQAPVAFDVFRHALERTAPDFCTFFTNHVAGIMHRYWKYAFPEDFGYELSSEVDEFHRESLLVALDHADEQIGFLMSYAAERGGRLYIASSMGQEAVHQSEELEVVVEDVQRFARAIGFRKPFTPLLAMHPDYAFELASDADAREFAACVETLRRANGRQAFYGVTCAGRTASCAAGSGAGFLPADGAAPYITRADSGARLSFEEAGLGTMKRDVGTGYHQPEGILIRHGAGIEPDPRRRRIDTIEIAPMILTDLGIGDDADRAARAAPPEARSAEKAHAIL